MLLYIFEEFMAGGCVNEWYTHKLDGNHGREYVLDRAREVGSKVVFKLWQGQIVEVISVQ